MKVNTGQGCKLCKNLTRNHKELKMSLLCQSLELFDWWLLQPQVTTTLSECQVRTKQFRVTIMWPKLVLGIASPYKPKLVLGIASPYKPVDCTGRQNRA